MLEWRRAIDCSGTVQTFGQCNWTAPTRLSRDSRLERTRQLGPNAKLLRLVAHSYPTANSPADGTSGVASSSRRSTSTWRTSAIPSEISDFKSPPPLASASARSATRRQRIVAVSTLTLEPGLPLPAMPRHMCRSRGLACHGWRNRRCRSSSIATDATPLRR